MVRVRGAPPYRLAVMEGARPTNLATPETGCPPPHVHASSNTEHTADVSRPSARTQQRSMTSLNWRMAAM
jgi:hypothetical protein